MKLLVFAHRLEIGGTQVNAIELAARLRDRHGFDIVFHAAPGPMTELLEKKGLTLVPAPDVRFHPAPSRIRMLRQLVEREKPDLIHAWDWWQGLETFTGVHLPNRVPMVITDMMMTLTRVLPKRVPTTFGFDSLLSRAQAAGWSHASLMRIPIDTEQNRPGAGGAGAREALGIHKGDLALVTVSRLANVLKSDSLLRTVDMVRHLGHSLPLRLVIVGDGEARAAIEARADEANRALGRRAIRFPGALNDPRCAYDAADIVIGMGGSALRGMAFAKPVVVTGQRGFARLFSARDADYFLDQSFYGTGTGGPDTPDLAAAIRRLAADPAQRAELGRQGRDFALAHHDLDKVADGFAALCAKTVAAAPPRMDMARDLLRSSLIYLRERRFRTASRDRLAGEGR